MKDIAWSTRSQTNGRIIRWSRWHKSKTFKRGDKTLCGKELPFAKWVTNKPDYRIQGGECQECKRLEKQPPL